MSTVVFQRLGDASGVRFHYHPDLVELIKTAVPTYARRYNPAAKERTVDAGYARSLARLLRCEGHTVVGLDEPNGARSSADPAQWAKDLLTHVGPTRRDVVFRALMRVLHPDNQQTGDTQLQRELNQARAELE